MHRSRLAFVLLLIACLVAGILMSTSRGSPANSPLDDAVARHEVNGGYLTAAGVHLYLVASTSDVIEINGELIDLYLSNPTTRFDTDNTIDVDGNDTTTLPAINTLYYVYCSNVAANDVYAGQSLRLSTSAPTLTSGAQWPACPYLNNTGNGKNWRYVGVVYLVDDGGGNPTTADTPAQRLVANHYNRRPRPLFACAGYADANSQTTYSFNSATWAQINAAAKVQFLVSQPKTDATFASGTDFAHVVGNFVVSATPAAVTQWGLGLDSTTDPSASASIAASAANSSVSVALDMTTGIDRAGVTTVYQLGMSNGASTVVADQARNGAAADPPATYLTGWVLQ